MPLPFSEEAASASGSGGPGISPRNDELSIINDALMDCGYDPVTVAGGDNSAAWLAGKRAYDRYLPVLMARHDWKFRTRLTTLSRQGTSTFPGLTDIYQKPADCLHIMACWDVAVAEQATALPQYYVREFRITTPKFDFKLIGDQVHCIGPDGVGCLYLPWPSSDADMPALFREALVQGCIAILQRGLNDDREKAVDAFKMGEMMLQEGRTRSDNQEPRRAIFSQRMQQVRRTRRY
jgi:hypothetical protein